ncbi:hypothetical protein BDN71DRAFT_1446292 [Pleurotus eryngii]|uniref:Uncharacterized protein n=1 Tax=Pleurotus eryngii TaxID=5323 RepID=A0A9P6DG78_PLEER|nr:hypothetical protein BDN71DRAFT_1446292 [Pleurotus eryngii]
MESVRQPGISYLDSGRPSGPFTVLKALAPLRIDAVALGLFSRLNNCNGSVVLVLYRVKESGTVPHFEI